MSETYVYVITSRHMPNNFYKIGRHTGSMKILSKRYKTQLLNNSVKVFHPCDNYERAEYLVHTILSEYRIKADEGYYSEWFNCDLAIIKKAIKCIDIDRKYDITHYNNTGDLIERTSHHNGTSDIRDLGNKILYIFNSIIMELHGNDVKDLSLQSEETNKILSTDYPLVESYKSIPNMKEIKRILQLLYRLDNNTKLNIADTEGKALCIIESLISNIDDDSTLVFDDSTLVFDDTIEKKSVDSLSQDKSFFINIVDENPDKIDSFAIIALENNRVDLLMEIVDNVSSYISLAIDNENKKQISSFIDNGVSIDEILKKCVIKGKVELLHYFLRESTNLLHYCKIAVDYHQYDIIDSLIINKEDLKDKMLFYTSLNNNIEIVNRYNVTKGIIKISEDIDDTINVIKIDKKKQWNEANKDRFICEACDYKTNNKTHYTRHCKSKKHAKNTV